MKGKNFQKLIKLSLLIAVILAISACHTCPEPVHITYERPEVPEFPAITWIDVPQVYLDSSTDAEYDILYEFFSGLPSYYGLNDRTTEFDDVEYFRDQYTGYLTKIDNLLKLYETDPQER